jgi:hypothetical protein
LQAPARQAVSEFLTLRHWQGNRFHGRRVISAVSSGAFSKSKRWTGRFRAKRAPLLLPTPTASSLLTSFRFTDMGLRSVWQELRLQSWAPLNLLVPAEGLWSPLPSRANTNFLRFCEQAPYFHFHFSEIRPSEAHTPFSGVFPAHGRSLPGLHHLSHSSSSSWSSKLITC